MRRKIYQKLVEWKNTDNGGCAMLIQGAKGVGKSYVAHEFGRKEYRSCITIDFNNADEYVKDLFRHDLDFLDLFFQKLSVHYGIPLYERDSLIILDDVQLFPRVRSAVKYLVADGRYDYLETGSQISIYPNVKDILIPSEEDIMNMYPMDFEEFLTAVGQEAMISIIHRCFMERRPLGEALHRNVMDQFRTYLLVGGMPQAVNAYLSRKRLEDADIVKNHILRAYRDEIRRYGGNLAQRIEAMFNAIPGQLRNENREFGISAIESGLQLSQVEEELFWLAESGIVNLCWGSVKPARGLRINFGDMRVKCFLGDTGLFIRQLCETECIASEELNQRIRYGNLEGDLSVVLENVAAQMLAASGHRLFYYSELQGETQLGVNGDFLIRTQRIAGRDIILPIKVTFGTDDVVRSMRNLRTKYGDYLTDPVVIHTSDYTEKEGIRFLPIYMTGLL